MTTAAARAPQPQCEKDWGFDQGVGATALWIAHVRTEEAKQERPLFADPFAARFAGDRGAEVERAICGPMGDWHPPQGEGAPSRLQWYAAVPVLAWLRQQGMLGQRSGQESEENVRTAILLLRQSIRARIAYLDRQMVDAAKELGICQIVTLAAGCDTRCLRLAGELGRGARHFLVDQPDVVGRYRRVLADELAEVEHIQLVDVKFGEDQWRDRLLAAGFDPSQQTFWLVEGLTMYLEAPVVDALFGDIAQLSAPGSVVAGDYLNDSYVQHAELFGMTAVLKAQSCEWVWSVRNRTAFAELLAQHGLRVEEDVVPTHGDEQLISGPVDNLAEHIPQHHVYRAVKMLASQESP